MFKIIFTYIFIMQFRLNYAVKFNVSAKMDYQNFVLNENDYPITLQIFDIREDMGNGDCFGECKMNSKKSTLTPCSIQDEEFRHLDVIINKRARQKHSGEWQCMFRIETRGQRDTNVFEYVKFNMTVKNNDVKSLPLMSLIDKPPLELSPSCEPKLEAKKVIFNITNPEIVNNFTIDQEDQFDTINILGIQNVFDYGTCTGWCNITDKGNITASSCKTTMKEIDNKPEKIAIVKFNELKLDKQHSGLWNCYIHLPPISSINNGPPYLLKMNITVNESESQRFQNEEISPSASDWFYIGIGLGVSLIVLIIIGQTICILYFKSKARKAEMVKNLTPKSSSENSPGTNNHARYVNKERGSREVARESGIYEALETVKERVPIPPPIETIPANSRPHHIRRSMSYNNLGQTTDTRPAWNNPHLLPNSLQHPRKIRNADKFTSLDRIRNRPPQPLPTEEIYEVMAPGLSPELKKATSRFNNKFKEKSPLLPSKQNKPINWNQSKEPAKLKLDSPATNKKLPIPTPGTSGPMPGPSRLMVPMGHPLPAPGVKPGVGPTPLPGSKKQPLKTTTVFAAMPVLPSMLSGANLKPVKHLAKPPVEEPSKNIPGNNSRTPGNGFRMPAVENSRIPPRDDIRIPTGNGFRMPPVEDARVPPGNGFRMPPVEDARVPPGNGFRMPPVEDARVPPGNGFRLPPVEDARVPPGNGFRMPPVEDARNARVPPRQGFRIPPRDDTRTPPGSGFRMPLADARIPARDDTRIPPEGVRIPPFDNYKPVPVLPNKPKPPMPVPMKQEPDPNVTSQEPGYYYGSSDEEFDCYDVLPDYRLYGNAPPKKFI